MGLVKRELEEANDRGWSAPEKVVCSDCVCDDFLKKLIQQHANALRCDYCDNCTSSYSAAPVEVIMPAVASALGYFYAEPTVAGVPYEGGWVLETTDTEDALLRIPLNCHDGLFEDIVDAFLNTEWVPAAEGNWASSHSNEEWSWAWQTFAKKVKHQSRHFFMPTNDEADGWASPRPLNILELVGEMAGRLNILVSLPEKTNLFRVRERQGDAEWPISAEQLGAPPNPVANAGRMNPAGISYLYLSKTEKGALAEVLHGPPCHAVVARFITVRPLWVLDLTCLSQLPSIFDDEQHPVREAALFLHQFVLDICQPVKKDGREHINYVPSQVVSEYFAQVFRASGGAQLDGIVYPSAVLPGGINLALFPRDERDPFGHAVQFESGTNQLLNTWFEFSRAIS